MNEKVRLQITNYGNDLSRKHDELVDMLSGNKIKYVTAGLTLIAFAVNGMDIYKRKPNEKNMK